MDGDRLGVGNRRIRIAVIRKANADGQDGHLFVERQSSRPPVPAQEPRRVAVDGSFDEEPDGHPIAEASPCP